MCLAIPGRIISIEARDAVLRSGRVDFAGVTKQVNLSYVPEAQVGDFVLVHVGFAIATVDAVEAGKVFEYLAKMGELAELAQAAEDSQPEVISHKS